MRKAQKLPWSRLVLAANTPMLTRAGLVDGQVEAGVLPAGQVVGAIDELPSCATVIEQIVDEAATTLTKNAPGAGRAGALIDLRAGAPRSPIRPPRPYPPAEAQCSNIGGQPTV